MDNEQILKKAIEKAVESGWIEGKNQLIWWKEKEIVEKNNPEFKDARKMLYENSLKSIMVTYFRIIFSHSFAKAFWGEKGVRACNCSVNWKSKSSPWMIDSWQYHLQQMVLAKDKLKYLEKFI